MRKIVFLLVGVLFAFSLNAKDINYNVKDFGAKGDGVHVDSEAINKAITLANKEGGGTVVLPGGKYLCGSIRMKSHVNLYLSQGCQIIAIDREPEKYYDQIEQAANSQYQDYVHSYFHNALIWADGEEDMSITGPGIIYGKGLVKDWYRDNKFADKSISMVRCRNVILRDFSIYHGGWLGMLLTGVDNLTIDNLKIDTNRDGMDIDCCKNVHVSNCYINSPYDDGICLKSSYALGYARVCENVTITNCHLSGYDEGTLLDGTYQRSKNSEYGYHPTGRIKFGTESNGGFINIAISNCSFDYCRGFAIESVDGAIVEDVVINNITMRDIVNDPIFIRLGARMRGPEEAKVGSIKRILFSNIMVYNAHPSYCSTISGIPGHYIEDITLSNIHIYAKGGYQGDISAEIPENRDKYPEPGMFGNTGAFGFFIRHARNVTLNNVEIHALENDTRSAYRLIDAHDVTYFRCNIPEEQKNEQVKQEQSSRIIIEN